MMLPLFRAVVKFCTILPSPNRLFTIICTFLLFLCCLVLLCIEFSFYCSKSKYAILDAILPGFILNLENLVNRPFLQNVRENLE